MNKKLVKRIAVANLVVLMAMSNLTAYAMTSVEIWENQIKKYEEQLKNYESYGNTTMVEKTKERIEQIKQNLEASKQRQAQQAQINAKQQAKQENKNNAENTTNDNEVNNQVKGSYANDIERIKLRINNINEEIADAKINDPSRVEYLEKDLFQENEELELYTLLQQYIVDEDPNVNPELIKKWNIHKLTGVERYVWYGRTEPLRITDDFIVYEDKTEFDFYYDKYDSLGGKTRAFGAVKAYDNDVKTNLDSNRYTVRSLSLPGEYHYIITDNMPNYKIEYKRDDINIKINRILTFGNIVECDYQVFDFAIECPLSVPENGSRVFKELVFEPNDINLYRIERSDVYYLYNKDEYYVYEGVQIKDNEELSKGINNYEIARKLRQTEVYPPTNNLIISREKISTEDISIKKLEFRVKYSNKQLSLGLAPEWDNAITK